MIEEATAEREEAGGRLIRAAEENRKLTVELNGLISQLRNHLVGSVPTTATGKDEVEPSGLVFKVSSDLEGTSRILREAIETTNYLCNEFSVNNQPTARAS